MNKLCDLLCIKLIYYIANTKLMSRVPVIGGAKLMPEGIAQNIRV
jgi:hypothetical protein